MVKFEPKSELPVQLITPLEEINKIHHTRSGQDYLLQRINRELNRRKYSEKQKEDTIGSLVDSLKASFTK